MPVTRAPHEPWRILLVEDDPIIAIMLEGMLHELKCDVVGPVGSVTAAFRLLSSKPIDGAVLDWNLGGETSLPVAEELMRRTTPFVFSTGYGAEAIGAVLDGIPVLTKPYYVDALGRELLPLLQMGPRPSPRLR